jgi:uncharacterized protein YcfJ
MKRKTLLLPLLLSLASAPLYAGSYKHHTRHGQEEMIVKARVSHVEPIIERVQIPSERRECWDEEVSGRYSHRSSDGMLVGAIIGGVIGHNIGNSRHRGATTAMGTLIGATIGHDADRIDSHPYRTVEQHCAIHTDYVEEERISGYRVSYDYQGLSYVTRMDRDPGRFVRLRLSLQLLD